MKKSFEINLEQTRRLQILKCSFQEPHMKYPMSHSSPFKHRNVSDDVTLDMGKPDV